MPLSEVVIPSPSTSSLAPASFSSRHRGANARVSRLSAARWRMKKTALAASSDRSVPSAYRSSTPSRPGAASSQRSSAQRMASRGRSCPALAKARMAVSTSIDELWSVCCINLRYRKAAWADLLEIVPRSDNATGRHSGLGDWDECSPLLAHAVPAGLPSPRQQPLQLMGLSPTRDQALVTAGWKSLVVQWFDRILQPTSSVVFRAGRMRTVAYPY